VLRVEMEYNLCSETSSPDICPVCGYPMDAIDNMTLDGRETGIGCKCTKCSYRAGLKKRIPGRYIFSRERPFKEAAGDADRKRMIGDAAKLMRKAASLVEKATKGTECGKRGRMCAKSISAMASSDNGIGLRGLMKSVGDSDGGACGAADMTEEKDDSDPEWTKPLSSVKNANRKDI
jgi:hypothetical protein